MARLPLPDPIRSVLFLSLFCWGFAPQVARSQPPTLTSKLEDLAKAHEGRVAIAVRHATTGAEVLINADAPMPTASLIKVAVMVEAYRQVASGKVDLNELLTLTEADKVPGSGILTTHFSAGLRLSFRDAIRLMIAYSDNTATNLVLDKIGLEATAAGMEQLGFPDTKIHAKVYRGDTSIFPDRSKEFGLGSTTAREMLDLLDRLRCRQLAGDELTDEMLGHLRACESKNTIPKFLPSKTVVAHKTGSVNAVRTAAGIIESPAGPLIIVVLTAENKDRRWTDDNAGELLCARAAQTAFEHFNPVAETETPEPGELHPGADGWLVEALQRTLNARLDPSPGLSVDGDYGPVTQKVVKTFQESRSLAPTGIVDAATWQALGPLLTSDEAITDPSQFDLGLAEKSPPDAVDGIPFVTCKGWIVGDAATEEIVGGNNLDTFLDNASTTKLLTAWITIRTAKERPELLDEIAFVSRRADETPGSTANLRAGEQLIVRDLLYGLLLPSGNDASVVLAEHLGGAFAPPESDPESNDPLVRFVAEMNRTAQELGMANSRFMNPHGLTSPGHGTTPRDLLKLAATIFRDGSLMPYVQTRKHVGRLSGSSGYVRYELWTNTNQLLNTEGYLGMKTGTTTAAGACLVSLAERDGHRLIAVVLGSTSPDGRYADTRNLFRWAWQQRAAALGGR